MEQRCPFLFSHLCEDGTPLIATPTFMDSDHIEIVGGTSTSKAPTPVMPKLRATPAHILTVATSDTTGDYDNTTNTPVMPTDSGGIQYSAS